MSDGGKITIQQHEKDPVALRENLFVELRRPLNNELLHGIAATKGIVTYRLVKAGGVLENTNEGIIANILGMQERYPDILMRYGRSSMRLFTKDEVAAYIKELTPIVKAMKHVEKKLFDFHQDIVCEEITDIFGADNWNISHKGKKFDACDLQHMVGEYYDYIAVRRNRASCLSKDIKVFERMLNASSPK